MGQRVLIVDDDPVIRSLMSDYLAAHGHSVQALDSGVACIDHLRRECPDILILDMIMPDLTGAEVINQIRSNPGTSALPVILLSADSRTAEAATSESAHADAYLEKPFKIQDVLQAVQNLVKK